MRCIDSNARRATLRQLLTLLFLVSLAACARGGDAPADEPRQAESSESAAAEEGAASDENGAPEHEEPTREPSVDPRAAQQRGDGPANEVSSALDAAFPCASSVSRALLARKIENREPADTQPPYVANGEQLHIFLELDNEVEGAKWGVTWRHPASDHSFNQEIEVGISPTWRTWLRHRIAADREGQWFVDVVAPGGCAAATIEFEAVGAG